MVSDTNFYSSFFNKILDLGDNQVEANEENPDLERSFRSFFKYLRLL